MAFSRNALASFQLCKIFMKPVSKVQSIVETSLNSVTITLTGTESFDEIPFMPGSAEYLSEQKSNEAGTYFEHTVKFFFPGESSANANLLLDYIVGKYILVVQDTSGLKHLVGSTEIPVNIAIGQSTKTGGRSFTFTWQSAFPSLYVN
ncbi:MAG: hypothetical protein ACOYMF_05470 [Bacteroidales bacterium]